MLLQAQRESHLSEAEIENIAESNELRTRLRYSRSEASDVDTPRVSNPSCNPDLRTHCLRRSKLDFFSNHIWVPFTWNRG
jgi:hypothetical protein